LTSSIVWSGWSQSQKILETALKADFKTAIFDVAFEMGVLLGIIAEAKANVANWMTPTEVEVPPGLASTGHQARIFHDPYGVALIIVPFNAPVALLIAPLVAALSAGNTAIVKPSPVTAHVVDTLETLFARYFAPEDVTMVRGNRHVVSALLELPFDFIFSHQ
jgi:aldehyde dehydrogenase (NAD+)